MEKQLMKFFCKDCDKENKSKEGEKLGICSCGCNSWIRHYENETTKQRKQIV